MSRVAAKQYERARHEIHDADPTRQRQANTSNVKRPPQLLMGQVNKGRRRLNRFLLNKLSGLNSTKRFRHGERWVLREHYSAILQLCFKMMNYLTAYKISNIVDCVAR